MDSTRRSEIHWRLGLWVEWRTAPLKNKKSDPRDGPAINRPPLPHIPKGRVTDVINPPVHSDIDPGLPSEAESHAI
jgi:hypothetical protein